MNKNAVRIFVSNPLDAKTINLIYARREHTAKFGGVVIYENVCWIHGSKFGTWNKSDYEKIPKDIEFIVTCFPAKVKMNYPEFADRIVGDWLGSTYSPWEEVSGGFCFKIISETYKQIVYTQEFKNVLSDTLF